MDSSLILGKVMRESRISITRSRRLGSLSQLIVEEFPSIRIIALSMYEAADMAEVMADAGAVGFVAKGEPAEVLITAIRNA